MSGVRGQKEQQQRGAQGGRGPVRRRHGEAGGQGPGTGTGDGSRAYGRERARSEHPGGRSEPRAPRGGGSGHPVQAVLKVTSRRRRRRRRHHHHRSHPCRPAREEAAAAAGGSGGGGGEARRSSRRSRSAQPAGPGISALPEQLRRLPHPRPGLGVPRAAAKPARSSSRALPRPALRLLGAAPRRGVPAPAPGARLPDTPVLAGRTKP